MASRKIDPLAVCKNHLDENQSFVLQGGAGSGKTETVKDLLVYLSKANPSARVICITHTNNAVHEIQERIGNRYHVSTIHSFLHSLIKNYKKNIHSVISELFIVPLMERLEFDENTDNEKEYKKTEHDRYKKIYSKFAKKLYSVKKDNADKVASKREYDKDPASYNAELNQKIESLNQHIKTSIKSMEYMKIKYNETNFDSLKDLSYGHDGLLTITHLLFKTYPTLGKIVKDKFDYIFIDEYQDTRQEVVSDLLELITSEDEEIHQKLTLCLFGDSMQAIYSDGIGSVDKYVEAGDLYFVPKADNYRCSYEVLDIINDLRLDDIEQEVALARLANGEIEKETARHGDVRILYGICDSRPTAVSPLEEKEEYFRKIDFLINEAKKDCENAKTLMLTNKAIAEKEGFKQLYKVFDDRYLDVKERIEEYLSRIQILDICNICNLYIENNYNPIIKAIRVGGYSLQNLKDKSKLQKIIEKLLTDTDLSLSQAFQFAVDNKLIKPTETCQNIFSSNEKLKSDLSCDVKYQEFKEKILAGLNTYSKIKDSFDVKSEEEFNDYKNLYKKEVFVDTLFSDSIKFSEVLNYTNYLNENSGYITMHKTKGSSIESVVVVMEEYFWNEYDFSTLYNAERATQKVERWKNSQKLIYVACSRAKKSLRCVRLLLDSEVESFKDKFPNAENINLPKQLL